MPTLITQCLQNDFVAPIGRYDPLPNQLHIGAEESRRLLGESPGEGALARLIEWAYAQPDEALRLIHIRDWHNAEDPRQASHLAQFGAHCVSDSSGADFVFAVPATHEKSVTVIDSRTLDDFLDTPLEATLREQAAALERIGLVGVWTEAKITFLAYELRSRHPRAEIAVCSALTASSSRARHVQALEQLRRLLGVRVFDSPGEFREFLGGATDADRLPAGTAPEINIPGEVAVDADDRALVAYLFRDCRRVEARALSGGYSGNRILACQSEDMEHRHQVPHVLKIGDRSPIAQERTAFENIESVLGNSAPQIVDFADFGSRGALKYRYASMGAGDTVTFQKLYQNNLPEEETRKVLDTVFLDQLGRLYASAERQTGDLMAYYGFDPTRPPRIRQHVEAILGGPAAGASLSLPGGVTVANPCRFYEQTLATLPRHAGRSWWFAWVHGDLNGANILLDGHHNVWLIDFFHAHRGHVLKDLIKLENDLLYLWTPCADEADFLAHTRLTDALLAATDLGAPLPDAAEVGLESPDTIRAWRSVGILRAYYPALIRSDRDPLQLLIGQLRYASHTLSFDECNPWQKLCALYATGRLAARLEDHFAHHQRLRVDWLPPPAAQLGITLLPGRRDYDRELEDDIRALRESGVTHALSLLTDNELAFHGVSQLPELMRRAGIEHLQVPVIDQQPLTRPQWREVLAYLDRGTSAGGRIAIHCVGGLGRSGMVAAAYLVKRGGLAPEDAIARVRQSRSQRAIETPAQESFVRGLARR